MSAGVVGHGGLVDTARPSRGDNGGFCAEDVLLAVPDAKTHGAHAFIAVHQQVRGDDTVVDFGARLHGLLGHDGLELFALYRDIETTPEPFVTVFVIDERKPPLLEHVDGFVQYLCVTQGQVLADRPSPQLRPAPFHQ